MLWSSYPGQCRRRDKYVLQTAARAIVQHTISNPTSTRCQPPDHTAPPFLSQLQMHQDAPTARQKTSEQKVLVDEGLRSRTEEHRVGKEGVGTCRTRGRQYHSKKNNNQ